MTGPATLVDDDDVQAGGLGLSLAEVTERYTQRTTTDGVKRWTWIRKGMIAVCATCDRVREGTITFAIEHARVCDGGTP